MAKVRVATFNCENLFARFKFEKNIDPDKATKDGFDVNQLAFDKLSLTERKLTGDAIRAVDADVLALQEVENIEILRRFRSKFLKAQNYDHSMLVDCQDPRHIDVAVLSRFPIVHARSYQHLKSGSQPLFSRDCLEVDIDVNGTVLTLFVNHFKSMLDKNNTIGGRAATKPKRERQSKAVKQIVSDRFSGGFNSARFVVLGDLNDYMDAANGIDEIVNWTQVENVVLRRPAIDQWTHYYAKGPANDRVKQLDYMLVSKFLAGKTNAVPDIERRGVSTKATEFTGTRFPGVTSTKVASDHCPVAMDLTL